MGRGVSAVRFFFLFLDRVSVSRVAVAKDARSASVPEARGPLREDQREALVCIRDMGTTVAAGLCLEIEAR